uniref:Portal protein n=1 Tax=viral metagenome TaxID=1070528 RepID=A0A6M3L8K9_9ZZZZ
MASNDKQYDAIHDKETALHDLYYSWRAIWDRNILKHKGQHWLEWNQTEHYWQSNKYRYQRVDRQYPTPTTNILAEKSSVIKSNVIKGFPLPYVSHRVGSEEAKRSARFQDIACKYYHEKLKMRLVLGDIVDWCQILGGCIAIPYWNLKTGTYRTEPKMTTRTDMVPTKIQMCQECGTESAGDATVCENCQSNNMVPETAPRPTEITEEAKDKAGNIIQSRIPVGDIGIQISTYYEWLFDPLHYDLEDMPWVMRRRVVGKKWIQDTFSVTVEDSSTKSIEEYWNVERFNGWTSTDVHNSYNYEKGHMQFFMKDACAFLEYWDLSSERDGMVQYTAYANEQLVKSKRVKKPYWIHFRFMKHPGAFYGGSLADLIISSNNRLNRIDQQFDWNRQMVVDPILYNLIGSTVENEEFYGPLGRIVNPISADQIGFIAPPGLDVRVYEQRKLILEDIDRMTVSDTFGGKLPAGRTPAQVVEMVNEKSSEKLTTFGMHLGEGMSQVYRCFMKLLHDKMPEERKFAIMGEQDEYEVEAFNGEALAGDEGYEDGGILITHEYDTIFPKSRAAEKAQVQEALQYGGLNPQDPFDKDLIRKKMGWDKEGAGMGFNVDVATARREIIQMEQGIDVTAEYAMKRGVDLNSPEVQQAIQQGKMDTSPGLRPGENSMVHLEIHRQDIQREKFDKLPPEVQKIKLRHFDFTSLKVQQEQQQRMMLDAQISMMKKGAPKDSGVPA